MLHLIVNRFFLRIFTLSFCCLAYSVSVQAADKKISIVTTTSMVADAVRVVGGKRVQVQALMGEGVDPHLYKASPGDLKLLTDAEIIFYNGLHLEGKMAEILEKLSKKKPVYAVASGIDTKLLRQPSEFMGQYDPHIWFDVTLWKQVVSYIAKVLIQRDPAGAEYYQLQEQKYQAELDRLHAEVLSKIATIPVAKRVLITAHDAFGYFGRAYAIEVRGIQGISTDSEASIQEMNALVDLISSRKIKAVFIESSVPQKAIEALIEGAASRGHKVEIGGQLYSDAMGKEGTAEATYLGMFRFNVSKIVEALHG
ncbi:zinc ABC transporter substrate-binding protein [bacterium]|nr:zinc ABC transporter substrate-binding protein [bacterium]